MNNRLKIAIFGAGSTGCYLAGELALAGLDVSLICRPRIKDAIIAAGGIHLTDYQDLDKTVMPRQLLTELKDETFDLVFVTVKCHQLEGSVAQLLIMTHSQSCLVLMQNGLGSKDIVSNALKQQHGSRQLLLGITPFNVLQKANGVFHKGTEGGFVFQDHKVLRPIHQALTAHGFSCELNADFESVIHGKLLLNLNNALNAIVDLSIKQQLSQRSTRVLLAKAMKEWLNVCHAAGFKLGKLTKMKPQYLPFILSLPDFLFTHLAKAMLSIDDKARSSMWEDIQSKRPTEIDYLNGAVVDLGQKYGVNTPVNSAIVEAIKLLEQGHKVSLTQLLQQTSK
ncbi:2-dehydropantoate 2-reductase [Shewanella sp. SR44-3]|uniref:2-dehydropantoate 2-reductase n=1 Tax=unclassified Shewanella TaxID=196818 RepID=UPI0015FE4192|nr:2-dehydropantoate 2-reductase [Shewanella sp. SR44-3]MBB1270931.1 2-dehydropantoate 2-reductase [Shewanella sp. SR44-3]